MKQKASFPLLAFAEVVSLRAPEGGVPPGRTVDLAQLGSAVRRAAFRQNFLVEMKPMKTVTFVQRRPSMGHFLRQFAANIIPIAVGQQPPLKLVFF
ncbi:hypothetical protein Q1695_011213 [Nippostrongylus brasiliensis]|nr:hypothetical protein Q1695_011213 [Nippostrongylus brasiliensis]